MTWRSRLRAWLLADTAPPPAAPNVMRISDVAMADARRSTGAPLNPWVVPEPAPGMGMAVDSVPANLAGQYAWAQQAAFSEGLGFLGYTYLAELSQRPEYRRIVEIYAREATRKWIKLRGDNDEAVGKLGDALKKWKVQETFRELLTHDGFFGRAHLYLDTGRPNDDAKPLLVRNTTIGKGRLKALRVVEPMWAYPTRYDAANPLRAEFYQPDQWLVMGNTVHASRLLTIVGREMPDILKPAYAFGGLSLTQMVKPYVDNWLRTRQSVSDLLHSFATMVLKTNMAAVFSGLGGAAARGLGERIQMFNMLRDNSGTMAIDKETEELECVAAPLGTLDKLQAQAQEQLASIPGIPLVILLGVTPSGLNASSDGEVRSFYANVKSYQEHAVREVLTTVLRVIQLSEFGAIDESIAFDFEDLWEMSDLDKAAIRKSDADADMAYVNGGVVSAEETRERLSNDETGMYAGVDLSGPAPEPEVDPSLEPDPTKEEPN